MAPRAAAIDARTFSLLAAVVMLAAAPAPPQDYRELTPVALKAMMAVRHVLLVNVHVPYEAYIPGTQLRIPYDQMEVHLRHFPGEKSAPIVLYCRSGPMSVTAAQQLFKLGYRNLYVLKGGMQAWSAAGYPLIGDSTASEGTVSKPG
jgi:rhodanese-related sulfurtransferase